MSSSVVDPISAEVVEVAAAAPAPPAIPNLFYVSKLSSVHQHRGGASKKAASAAAAPDAAPSSTDADAPAISELLVPTYVERSIQLVEAVISDAMARVSTAGTASDHPVFLVKQSVLGSLQFPSHLCNGALELVHHYGVVTTKTTTKASQFVDELVEEGSADEDGEGEDAAAATASSEQEAQQPDAEVAEADVEVDADADADNTYTNKYNVKHTISLEFSGHGGIVNSPWGELDGDRIGVYVPTGAQVDPLRVTIGCANGAKRNTIYLPHGRNYTSCILDSLGMAIGSDAKAVLFVADSDAVIDSYASACNSVADANEKALAKWTAEKLQFEAKHKIEFAAQEAEYAAATAALQAASAAADSTSTVASTPKPRKPRPSRRYQTTPAPHPGPETYRGWSTFVYNKSAELVSIDNSNVGVGVDGGSSNGQYGLSTVASWTQRYGNSRNTINSAVAAFNKYRNSSDPEQCLAGYNKLVDLRLALPHPEKKTYKKLAFAAIASLLRQKSNTSVIPDARKAVDRLLSSKKRSAAAEDEDAGDHDDNEDDATTAAEDENVATTKKAAAKKRKVSKPKSSAASSPAAPAVVRPEATQFLIAAGCRYDPNPPAPAPRVTRKLRAELAADAAMIADATFAKFGGGESGRKMAMRMAAQAAAQALAETSPLAIREQKKKNKASQLAAEETWSLFNEQSASDPKIVTRARMVKFIWQYIHSAGLKVEQTAKANVTVDALLATIFRDENGEKFPIGTQLHYFSVVKYIQWLFAADPAAPVVIAAPGEEETVTSVPV